MALTAFIYQYFKSGFELMREEIQELLALNLELTRNSLPFQQMPLRERYYTRLYLFHQTQSILACLPIIIVEKKCGLFCQLNYQIDTKIIN